MNIDAERQCLRIQSLLKTIEELQVSLPRTSVPDAAAREVIVRVEAKPINPSGVFFCLLGLTWPPRDTARTT